MNSPRRPLRPAFAVLAVIFGVTAIYSFTRPKVYEAKATLEAGGLITTRCETPLVEPAMQCGPDAQTYIKVIQSQTILAKVDAALPSDVRAQIASGLPAQTAFRPAIHRGLRVAVEKRGPGFLLIIAYRHRSPEVAAKLADAFAAETNALYRRIEQDGNTNAVSEIEKLLARAKNDADTLATSLQKSAVDEIRRLELEAELKEKRALADTIGQRLAETRDYLNHVPDPFRFTPAAVPSPSDYVSPNHLLNLSVGFAAGLMGAAWVSRRRATGATAAAPSARPPLNADS